MTPQARRRALHAAAKTILRAGLAAVAPAKLVRQSLRVSGDEIHACRAIVKHPRRVIVIAVGKAAPGMARASRRILGRRISDLLVVAPQPFASIAGARAFIAGHPLPDARGVRAAKEVISLLEGAGRNDLVLLLLSGGASALLPAPTAGVSLREKRRITSLLLACGATIREMNVVRKQMSRLKGGGFARIAAPARVVVLAISDVPGDDPGVIGSGPAVEDRGAQSLARRVVKKFLRLREIAEPVQRAIFSRHSRAKAARSRAQTFVIGSGRTFAEAARRKARELGFRTRMLLGGLRGEARSCGPRLARLFTTQTLAGYECLIATGETTVRVRGPGIGGRNQELALAATVPLSKSRHPVVLASFGTDGRDGPTPAAGGIVDDTTLSKAKERRLSVSLCLDRNDSYPLLKRLNSLIRTDPTGTNVADVTVFLR